MRAKKAYHSDGSEGGLKLMKKSHYILLKSVCYFVLLVLSLMVEDEGEFRIALISAIILAEVAIYFLQKKSSV